MKYPEKCPRCPDTYFEFSREIGEGSGSDLLTEQYFIDLRCPKCGFPRVIYTAIIDDKIELIKEIREINQLQ